MTKIALDILRIDSTIEEELGKVDLDNPRPLSDDNRVLKNIDYE